MKILSSKSDLELYVGVGEILCLSGSEMVQDIMTRQVSNYRNGEMIGDAFTFSCALYNFGIMHTTRACLRNEYFYHEADNLQRPSSKGRYQQAAVDSL